MNRMPPLALPRIARLMAGALMFGAVTGVVAEPGLIAGQAAAQTADQQLEVDLPALPLAQAITRIAQIAGTSVLVQGDGHGRLGPPLAGPMSLETALTTVLADSGGQYRIDADGRLVVTLSQRRTQTQAVPPASPGITLAPVVVTATGSAQPLSDAPASVTIIAGDDLRARPMLSVADALRDVPGVSVGAPGRDGGTAISIRGMGQPYVLFMIDGKPLGASEEATYNAQGTGTKPGFLPPASVIDRIEIIRGPMSSLYGSAALGGVINVITLPIPKVWSGNLDLGATRAAGGRGTTEGRFMLGGPVLRDQLGLMIYGARSGWSRANADAGSRVPDSGTRINLGARLGWVPAPDQRLDLDVWGSRLAFASVLRGAVVQDSQVRNRGASLTHHVRWGADGAAETTSFLLHERTDFHIGNNSGHDAWTLSTRSSVPIGPHDLTLGFEHRQEQTRHDPNRLPDSAITRPRRWHQALFGEMRLALTPDLTGTLGLRYDRDQDYRSQLTPRLYAVWHVTDALTLRGGIGGGYRVPALKQADDNVWEPSGGDGGSRDRGNSALRPESSTNVDLGVSWQSDRGARIGVTAYHSRFRDRISRRDLCRTPAGAAPACRLNGGDFEAITQYVNDDRARLSGAEVTLNLPLDSIDITANYTLSTSRITRGQSRGMSFNNLPRHVLDLALDWRATQATTLWSRAQFRSKAQGAGRTESIAAHTIVDVGLDHRLGPNATLALSVQNIGNVRVDDSVIAGRRLSLGLGTSF